MHQDRGLSIPMRSMVDLTGVRMAKEDPGLMTSTGFQVCLNLIPVFFFFFFFFFYYISLRGGIKERKVKFEKLAEILND